MTLWPQSILQITLTSIEEYVKSGLNDDDPEVREEWREWADSDKYFDEGEFLVYLHIFMVEKINVLEQSQYY